MMGMMNLIRRNFVKGAACLSVLSAFGTGLGAGHLMAYDGTISSLTGSADAGSESNLGGSMRESIVDSQTTKPDVLGTNDGVAYGSSKVMNNRVALRGVHIAKKQVKQGSNIIKDADKLGRKYALDILKVHKSLKTANTKARNPGSMLNRVASLASKSSSVHEYGSEDALNKVSSLVNKFKDNLTNMMLACTDQSYVKIQAKNVIDKSGEILNMVQRAAKAKGEQISESAKDAMDDIRENIDFLSKKFNLQKKFIPSSSGVSGFVENSSIQGQQQSENNDILDGISLGGTSQSVEDTIVKVEALTDNAETYNNRQGEMKEAVEDVLLGGTNEVQQVLSLEDTCNKQMGELLECINECAHNFIQDEDLLDEVDEFGLSWKAAIDKMEPVANDFCESAPQMLESVISSNGSAKEKLETLRGINNTLGKVYSALSNVEGLARAENEVNYSNLSGLKRAHTFKSVYNSVSKIYDKITSFKDRLSSEIENLEDSIQV